MLCKFAFETPIVVESDNCTNSIRGREVYVIELVNSIPRWFTPLLGTSFFPCARKVTPICSNAALYYGWRMVPSSLPLKSKYPQDKIREGGGRDFINFLNYEIKIVLI